MSEATAISADLAPAPPAAGPAASRGLAVPERLRALFDNPAVARARPALIAVAAAAAVVLAALLLREPDWRPLYPGLSDGDAAAVTDALAAANFPYRINRDTGTVEVASADVARARILLAGQGLPKASSAAGNLDDMPLGASRSVEAARLKAALARDLAASVEAIDGVKAARVHVAVPEPSVFIRDRAQPSASVFVTLAPGRSLSEAQVRAIIWLVATSVPGLTSDRVSVVDQSGMLRSAGVSGDAQQLAYQQRLEQLVRERLLKLLTPMLGQGRFTAEVAADVDFSENEAASERFQPAGTVRTEQTSRSMENAAPPAQGIPGATTNTVPQAAQVNGNPPPAAAAPPQPPVVTQESTARSFEIGKDVSVTRAGAPRVKRLSVAVVVDTAALGGKNAAATAREVANIQRLIRGAMGYDQARGDLVEVQTRAFADDGAEAPAWYDTPAVRDYGPIALGAVALLAVAVAALIITRRRKKAAAAIAAATDAAAAAASGPIGPDGKPMAGKIVAMGPDGKPVALAPDGTPIDGGDLRLAGVRALDFTGKLDQARILVTGDRDRAMAVARQMLLADMRPETDEDADESAAGMSTPPTAEEAA